MVYVHTPVEECERRMRARGRAGEEGVDVDRLKRLEFQYETMLRYSDVPVVRVDGTSPPELVAAEVARVAAGVAESAAARARLTRA